MMNSDFIIAVSTVATLAAGNQFDCKIQDFPINLRKSHDGDLEAIFELESTSLNWTLELRVKNSTTTLVRMIFDAWANKLMMNCSGTEETKHHFLWSSTYKIKVGKTLSELSQLKASGEFESILRGLCVTPKHFRNVILERFGRQGNNGLNVSVCSLVDNTAADVSIVLVVSVGFSLSVILLVSAVSYYLLKNKKKKTAAQTPKQLHCHNMDNLLPTQPQRGLLVPNFQNSLSLDRWQLRAHNSNCATTLLSSSPELMSLEPLMLHGYTRNFVQEPISHSTLTLPQNSGSRVFYHPDSNLISSRVSNENQNSQPPLTFNSVTPVGHRHQYSRNSHLVVSSPRTSRSLLHSPQLAMPMSHQLTRALQEVPSHYSTTGRPRLPATVSYQNLSFVPKIALRTKSSDGMEDDIYERITFVFSDK